MDTREKILGWAEFRKLAGSGAVAGYFDPLTVDHSARLEELAAQSGPLCIVIHEPERPLLPAEARAALIASLACVKAVSVAQGDIAAAVDLRAEDLERRNQMMAHVHSRHGR